MFFTNVIWVQTGDDLSNSTWSKEGTLLTMRVPLRDAWNSARVKSMARQLLKPVYILKAYDTVKGLPVTTSIAARLAARNPDQNDRDIPLSLPLV